MKQLLLVFLFAIFTMPAVSQELTIPVKLLSNSKAGPERFIGTDAFGWKYTTLENEFRKEKDGRTLKYKNVALGEIYRVDLQNPLQIVLFYRKFNTVVLLDNQLNETSQFNFSTLPEQELIVEAAGLASQNRLWLYDVTTQQIGLYDTARGIFRTLTPPFNDGIKYYQSDYNYFYWIDTTGKYFAVNLFGNVSFLGNIPQYDGVQLLSSTEVLISSGNALYLYNLAKQSTQKIEIVEKTLTGFYYKDQILSIFTNNEIIQYKITLSK
ncbi:hypothetical protein FMM05_03215 [Flavobacterium zepuense]|uniref:Uncharacterized protein n=1 Tax=Flavobacterium zepuense TaxID=2593302 RepID=A0A552V7G6_9FLAO|nr:hypothetical protein [Flavobacterium zepuense]TRW26404.1 hypothetical protein FMM05_03215 [Flavobacterium zepuense]